MYLQKYKQAVEPLSLAKTSRFFNLNKLILKATEF